MEDALVPGTLWWWQGIRMRRNWEESRNLDTTPRSIHMLIAARDP